MYCAYCDLWLNRCDLESGVRCPQCFTQLIADEDQDESEYRLGSEELGCNTGSTSRARKPAASHWNAPERRKRRD